MFQINTPRSTAPPTAQSRTRPPTNTREKRTAHLKARKTNYANKYLRDLRRSFDDADENKVGYLTQEQWQNSSIRFYLHEGKMPNADFAKYFFRIDANCDNKVSWEELVDFILLDLTCVTGSQTVESSVTLNKSPISSSLLQCRHRESITQIVQSTWTEEYITVSRDAIKFWKPIPLSYSRKFNHPGPFACVCFFKYFAFMAVATSTRVLSFYKVVELEQLPVGLSASPSSKSIKAMLQNEAESAMNLLNAQDIPLFNIPTQMVEASFTETPKNQIKLLIADDCGCIELFTLTLPQRRTGTDYSLARTIHYELHKNGISQLSLIDEISSYASSSSDGTVKFFTILNDSVCVTRVFDDGSSVLSFAFVGNQNSLAMCTRGNDPFIWANQPVHRAFRLTGNMNAALFVTEYISSFGERFVITVTSKKELRLYDSINFVQRNEFCETEFLPPDDRITAILFDKTRKILVTCASFPVIWLEGEVDGHRGITHQSTIVGLHYQPDFDQLLSVDAQANFMIWDYSNGLRKSIRTPKVDEISSATIDITGRRVITATFSGGISIWNPNSGGLISNIDGFDHSQISVIRHFTLNGRGFLFTAGWSKVVCLYREISPSIFELKSRFSGHLSDISAAVLDEKGWIITGSDTGEIFAWPIDMSTKPRSSSLIFETPIEGMTVCDRFLIVADSDGFLTVLNLPSLEELLSIKAHLEIVPYSISAISSNMPSRKLITGDSLGYVRIWLVTTEPVFNLDPLKMQRCHDNEVTQIEFIGNKGRYFATAGFDMAVRIWTSDSIQCVGTLNGEATWDLKEVSTWFTDSPIESDERHFKPGDAFDLNRSQPLTSSRSLKSTRSVKSMKSCMSLATAVSLTSNRSIHLKEDDEEEEERIEFDYEKARAMLDMIQNSTPAAPPSMFERPYSPIKETKSSDLIETKIKDDYQVNDLMVRIKKLQEKKPTPIEDYFPEMKDKKKQEKLPHTFA